MSPTSHVFPPIGFRFQHLTQFVRQSLRWDTNNQAGYAEKNQTEIRKEAPWELNGFKDLFGGMLVHGQFIPMVVYGQRWWTLIQIFIWFAKVVMCRFVIHYWYEFAVKKSYIYFFHSLCSYRSSVYILYLKLVFNGR